MLLFLETRNSGHFWWRWRWRWWTRKEKVDEEKENWEDPDGRGI